MDRHCIDELNGRPGAYVCNCGPHCTTGHPMYDKLVKRASA